MNCLAGAIVARRFTGTYAVAADCSFTVELTNTGDGTTGHIAGVIVDRGERSLVIVTDPFNTLSGSAARAGK